MDGHWKCLKCLGSAHDTFNCNLCDVLPDSLKDIRLALVSEALAKGSWSVDWLERVRSVESLVFAKKQGVKSKNITSPKTNLDSNLKSNTKSKGAKRQTKTPELVDESSSSSEEEESNLQTENNTSPNTNLDSNKSRNKKGENILSPNIQLDSENLTTQSTPAPNPTPESTSVSLDIRNELSTWQAGIDQTVGALSLGLQQVLQTLQELKKPDQPKPKKTSKKSKSKTDTESMPPPKKKKRVSETAPNPEPVELQTDYDFSLPTELGIDLVEHGGTPPPPNEPIPRRIPSELDIYSQYASDSDESEEMDIDIDMGRKDKRKLYLQSLKTLVPTLKHDKTRDTTTESGHFSLVSQRPSVPKMPFLDEIFDQVGESSIFNKQKPFLKKMEKFYPTTEPAESGLLGIRKVPNEILYHVPTSKLGALSGSTPTLNKHFVEGTKETAAIQSFKYSAAALRLSNNMEIGVEAQGSLINRCASSLDKIKEVPDLPRAVLNQVGSIQSSLALMKQTMFDLKATNNDLLQLALGQYNESLVSRREAWLTATDLPKNLVQDLKNSELPKPLVSDSKGQVSMFHQYQMSAIKEHTAAQKDSAIIKLCTQRGRGRGQQGRSRPPRRGSFSGGRGFQHQPSFDQQPRGRGRGRPYNRGRGGQSSFSRGNTQKRV